MENEITKEQELDSSFERWLNYNEIKFREIFKEKVFILFNKYPELDSIEIEIVNNPDPKSYFFKIKPGSKNTDHSLNHDALIFRRYLEKDIPKLYMARIFPKNCRIVMDRENIDFLPLED